MSGFVDVREPYTDKLLFRFDPNRDIIEVQRRGVKTVVDLTQYRAPKGAPDGEHTVTAHHCVRIACAVDES